MADVVMPQMGESIVEGTLTRWLKKVGEKVERDEPLFEISTDKVDTEIPAPEAGVLTEILVAEGTTVGINTVVGRIGAAASAPAAQPAATAPPAPAAAPPAPAAQPSPAVAAAPPPPAPPPAAVDSGRRPRSVVSAGPQNGARVQHRSGKRKGYRRRWPYQQTGRGGVHHRPGRKNV